MRIKHWQGYGCVNAKVTRQSFNTWSNLREITIEVKGNHEYGLDRSDDKYDVFNWLLKRFDKNVVNMSDRIIKGIEFQYLPSVRENNCDVERAQYTIVYSY